jgi:uncharacterized protein (DUF1800 family)
MNTINGLLKFIAYALVFIFIQNANALGFNDANHLITRTGFSITSNEIRSIQSLNRVEAINYLIKNIQTQPTTKYPSWVAEDLPIHLRIPKKWKKIRRQQFRKERLERTRDLKEWWLKEMHLTSSPLTERLVLFWHNHFPSQFSVVRSPYLMWQQNNLIRRHAGGNFAEMLRDIIHDGAMMVYLDLINNRKAAPNENFARELLELFTMGKGYTEKDIKEVSRAFTGWNFDRSTGKFNFNVNAHDNGKKTILGIAGNFRGENVVEILLRRPETALMITRKMWREFINDDPSDVEVERLAKVFRESGYEIKVLLRNLLLTEQFWSPEVYGDLVRSPVHLFIGTIRTLNLPIGSYDSVYNICRSVGQDLLEPPNVKGWEQGKTWLDARMYLKRQQHLETLLNFLSQMDKPIWGLGIPDVKQNMMMKNLSIGFVDPELADGVMNSSSNMSGVIINLKNFNLEEVDSELSSRLYFSKLLLPISYESDNDPSMEVEDALRDVIMDPRYQLH